MIKEIPKPGTLVIRDKDQQLYSVGDVMLIDSFGKKIRLYPVCNGRTHNKSITHFLNQYTLA